MTKYWVLTMIGAVGLAALIHPERMRFLCSPAPWVAIATVVVAMIPHLIWLKEVDFVPLTYAGDVYGLSSRAQSASARARLYRPQSRTAGAAGALHRGAGAAWSGRRAGSRAHVGRGPSGVNVPQALNVWIIQAIVAIGPPLGGLIFTVYMKTDWGISLFFLVPLALVAIPALRMPQHRAVRGSRRSGWCCRWRRLPPRPASPCYEMERNPNSAISYGARSQLARELTEAWHSRFGSRWAVVAGTTEIGEPMTFYSPDHPAPFTPGEAVVVRADVIRGSQAARLHRHLRHHGRPPAGVRGLDEGECARRRAAGHDHAALLPRPSGPAIAGRSISCRRRSDSTTREGGEAGSARTRPDDSSASHHRGSLRSRRERLHLRRRRLTSLPR